MKYPSSATVLHQSSLHVIATLLSSVNALDGNDIGFDKHQHCWNDWNAPIDNDYSSPLTHLRCGTLQHSHLNSSDHIQSNDSVTHGHIFSINHKKLFTVQNIACVTHGGSSSSIMLAPTESYPYFELDTHSSVHVSRISPFSIKNLTS